MKLPRRGIGGTIAVLAMLPVLSVPAAAQVEEIVVTAKQREQRLQDVALSIATLNEGELDRARITDLRDLAEFTPNLVFSSGTGRETPSILAIRGIAPNTGSIRLQGVSVFLDGVYIGGGIQSLDLTQLERVEVLRGPQATTFGRQTYAGAINYVTKDPRVDEITGVVKADISSNRGSAGSLTDNWQLSGTVQMPLIQDAVWLELGGTRKVEGPMAFTGSRGLPIGEERTEAITGALLIEPIENLTIRLRGLIGSERDSVSLTATTHPQEWEAFGIPTAVRGGGVIWPVGNLQAPPFDAVDCESTRDRPVDCGVDRDREFFSSNISYLLGGYELSYIFGWGSDTRWSNQDLYFRGSPDPFFGTQSYSVGFDGDGDPIPNKSAPFFNAQRQDYLYRSHEIRILSPEEDRLSWRAGLYYFSERDDLFLSLAQNPNNPDGRLRAPEGVRNYAAYGGVNFEFTDWFSMEAELRLQREESTLGSCNPCFPTNFRASDTKETNTDALPRLTAMFRPTEDMMFYALWSQGTKAGRFNTSIASQFRFADPEKLTNYELGAKTEWFDGRLVVNAATFLMRVRDQQFSSIVLVPDPEDIDPDTGEPVLNPVTSFENVGKSRSIGFELDAFALLTERWTVGGALAYARQKYTSDFVPTDGNLLNLFDGETFKGKTSVGLPRWTASASTQYVYPVNADMDLVLDGSLTYRGSSYADQANLAKIDSIARVNVRAALDLERWEFAIFARDLFSNDIPSTPLISQTNACLYLADPDTGDAQFAPGQRCLAVGLDRGREVGASVRLRF